MNMRIVPLGTRGWIPSEGRSTMCILVQMHGHDILLDCGTGVSRLLQADVRKLLGSGPLYIILSHYHLDHFIGLTYLSALFDRQKEIRLIGPGSGTVDIGLLEACRQLGAPPIFGTPFSKWDLNIHTLEYDQGGFEINDIRIHVLKQVHKGGAVSLKLGQDICYVTDASPSPETAQFANGVECLLHEAYSLEEGQKGTYHSNFDDALSVAQAAEVSLLVPVHFGPSVSEDEIRGLKHRKWNSVHIVVPDEGQALPSTG